MRYTTLALVMLASSLGADENGCGPDDPPNPSPPDALLDPACVPLAAAITACGDSVDGYKGLYSCAVEPKLFRECRLICSDSFCQSDNNPPNLQGSYLPIPNVLEEIPPGKILISTGTSNKDILISGSSPLVRSSTPDFKALGDVALPATVYGNAKNPNDFTVYRVTKRSPCSFEAMVIYGSLPGKGGGKISCDPIVGINFKYLTFNLCKDGVKPEGLKRTDVTITENRTYTWQRVLDKNYWPTCEL